jgi:hypothetical protein
MRVIPSEYNAPIEDPESAVKKPPTTRQPVLRERIKHEVTPEPESLSPYEEFNAALQELNKHEWSSRLLGYEHILQLMKTPNFNIEPSKVISLYMNGLEDQHFRVIKVVLDGWDHILPSHGKSHLQFDLDTATLESLVPRCLSIVEDPQLRTKLGIREQTMALYQRLKEGMNQAGLVQLMLNLLNAPEYAKNVRVRQGALSTLAELLPRANEFFTKVQGQFQRHRFVYHFTTSLNLCLI